MRLLRVFKVLLSLLLFVSQNAASKILGIFPMPSKSHTILGTALLKELALRGHQVTMLSPFLMDNLPAKYTQVHWDYLQKDNEAMKTFSNPNLSGFAKLKIAVDGIPKFVDNIHNNTNIKTFLDSNEKFDLCIYLLGVTDSFLGICHHVNATIIGFNTVGMNIFMGQMTMNPTPYSYVPNIYLPFTDNMNFLQRVGNTIAWTVSAGILNIMNAPLQQYLLSKYYPNAPPLDELLESVDLILANSNYATDTLVPLLPNIIPIGGFHLEEKVEISAELQSYLDNSKNGIIYFNLGTNAKGKFIQPETLQHLINTFAKLPYDILWKYEDEMSDIPKNIKLEKWLPQRQILMHSNVKLFITHGGNGGTIEAIYGGVPMICMPHYGDQLKNCAGSVGNGYAIHVDISTMTEEILTKAINELLSNHKYKESIMLHSDVYRNQAINPMDRAVFWIEHVIRHKGAKHLKSQAAQLSWYQRNLIDVFAFFGCVLIISLASIYFSIKYCLKLMYNKIFSSQIKKQKMA